MSESMVEIEGIPACRLVKGEEGIAILLFKGNGVGQGISL